MINLKLFKKILEQFDKRYIDKNDYISEEFIEFIRLIDVPIAKIEKLFCINPVTYPLTYFIVYVECAECKKTWDEKMTKTKLIEYLRFIKGVGSFYQEFKICKECKEVKIIEENKAEKLRKEIEFEEGDDYYKKCFNYIDPNYIWDKNIPYKDRFITIHSLMVNRAVENKMVQKIKVMPYSDFLETPYWKAIANKVRYEAGYMCKLCGKKDNLVVHHNNYENHGYEHRNWKTDLICICSDCHELHHLKTSYEIKS